MHVLHRSVLSRAARAAPQTSAQKTHLARTMAADKILDLFCMQAQVIAQICRALPEDAADDDVMSTPARQSSQSGERGINHGSAAPPLAKKPRTRGPEDYDDEQLREMLQALTATA